MEKDILSKLEVARLIALQRLGILPESEERRLSAWVERDEKNKAFYEQLRQKSFDGNATSPSTAEGWNLFEKKYRTGEKGSRPFRRTLYRLVASVAVLVLAITGTYYYLTQPNEEIISSPQPVSAVQLVLENGNKITLDDPSLCASAKRMAGAASYARMHGVPLPVMTATGSGNQGITLFLTVDAAARYFSIPEEKELRAIALAALANVYIKSFIGPLSSVCACGVASGLSASLGVVYLLGGGEGEMVQAARNILGSVSGMICDGAKEGCASKVALSAGLAVEAACLALEGGGIHAQDGILDDSFDRLIAHLGELVCVGMGSTNSTIVHIMKDEKGYAASC